ncbi:hypothetical protein [Streptomyces fagopyri]|uniref:hypothetical protein n=1 Tax=Streptomyces fagopyri TaxID=2662397 RepID=UPI0038046A8C
MNAPRTSEDRIREHFGRLYALFAPSVVTDAAAYLDALTVTAGQHGHAADPDHVGMLAQVAAEVTPRKYHRPSEERSGTEVYEMLGILRKAFEAAGLTIAGSQVRMGAAVEPLEGGPVWGWDGKAGLSVALYSDSGWELMVNQPQTRIFSIYAPVTVDGAAEVAAIVRSILTGETPDPFRNR